MSNWIDHVKSFQKKHNCSYKDALKGAKQTYKGGGNQAAGYIQALIANELKTKNNKKFIDAKKRKKIEHKFDISKMPVKNNSPSMWIRNWVAGHPVPENVQPQPEPEPEPMLPIPEPEPEYEDFNVGNNRKNKNKNKKANNHIDDREADRIAVENERKKKIQVEIQKLVDLEKDISNYREQFRQLKFDYTRDLQRLKKLRQTQENKKLYDDRIKQNVADKKDLKNRYPKLIRFASRNSIPFDDLDWMEDYIQGKRNELQRSNR